MNEDMEKMLQEAPAPDQRRTERDAPLRRIFALETQKISRPARP